MNVFCLSSAGRKPGQNEDSFIAGGTVSSDGDYQAELKPPFFCGAADGVSGEKSGDIASALALSVLCGMRLTEKTDILKSVMDIHKFLKSEGERRKSANMQTTLCVAAVFSHKIKIANVGDSRAYLYKAGKLTQITRDQSLLQLLYEQGQLSKREKNNFLHKNIILPALGNIHDDPAPELIEIPPLSHGEILFICTDGFSDFVNEETTEQILKRPENLGARLKLLLNRAIMNGSKDNITLLTLTN
ncbi:MAG: protein phosphatase 2C domain-containing protein [Ruminococcus sp.]|jgi:protein phosphatase|nr:protein phosphatase 2C domain-containing protein [Ruminococcus sp.]